MAGERIQSLNIKRDGMPTGETLHDLVEKTQASSNLTRARCGRNLGQKTRRAASQSMWAMADAQADQNQLEALLKFN